MAKNNRTRKTNNRAYPEKPGRGPLVIYVNPVGHGGLYDLGPLTEERLEELYPHVKRPSFVQIGYPQLDPEYNDPTPEIFEKAQSAYWPQVAAMLTGLTAEQLADLGVTLYDPETERLWKLNLQEAHR